MKLYPVSHGEKQDVFHRPVCTRVDLILFADILNKLNTLNPDDCYEFCRYFIVKAKSFRNTRIATERKILMNSVASKSLYAELQELHDPALTTCIVGTCLKLIYSSPRFRLFCITDSQTASDVQAKKPADLCLYVNHKPILAVEVKGKGSSIDWTNIRSIEEIIQKFPTLRLCPIILEDLKEFTSPAVASIISSPMRYNKKFEIIPLRTLYNFALFSSSETILRKLAFSYILQNPNIKTTTLQKLAQS